MGQETSRGQKSMAGLFFAAVVIFFKSTKIIAALKVLKFGKPLVTIVSMAISAVFYGIWLGPWFGVGLVAMIFIHEMGHVIALRLKGMETPGPVFIPFLGAAIFVPKFKDRDTEAYVGYGGPLLGTAGALACLALLPFVEGKTAEIVLLVSYVGVFINLFNLVPISPLDGGRITQAVGSWFKYVGFGILLVYTLAARQPALLLIWILVLDSFDRMTLWLRPLAASVLVLAMAVLMLAGFSSQPWYVDCVDVSLAALLTLLYWTNDKLRRRKGAPEEADERDYPTGGVRTKWFVLYLGLVVLTTVVLLWQVDHLPPAVKAHSEQLTSPQVQ